MRGVILVRGFGGRGLPNDGRRGRGSRRSNASSSSSSSSSPSSSSPTLSSNPLLKAALTSGGLSLAGDLLAQGLTYKLKQNKKPEPEAQSGGSILGKLLTKKWKEAAKPAAAAPFSLDLPRAARMGLFGLLFYGPYQFWWYGLLDRSFPGRSTQAFASKVTLNQVALAPVVLAAVFAWNLVPLGRGAEWPAKVRRDLLPTMVNGWKFWVPAASVNFWAVPLEGQVAYMSACGLLWTAYLSYSSN